MDCKDEIYKLPWEDISSEKMKEYEGEYVVFHKDKIVEHNKDFSKILKLAKNYPKDEVLITKIYSSDEVLF